MKRLVIRNKFRFITFLLTVFILLSVVLVSVLQLGTVYSKSDVDSISYIVSRGETLWDIAKTHNKNEKDLRKVIYEIKKYNNIGSTVFEGQELKIPL